MAEDKYKVDKTKPPKPIQLKDASGPPIHELSDERNYEFLNKLFKMKELDPFAKESYSVDNVYQLMDEDLSRDITNPIKKDKSKWTGYGQYAPHLADLIFPLKKNRKKDIVHDTTKLNKVFKDYTDEQGISLVFEDLKKYRPDLLKGTLGAKDVIAQYDQWNTDQGLGTLLHEMRHKAFEFEHDPIAHSLIKQSEISEEIFTRVMDVKYGDEQTGENAKRFIKNLMKNDYKVKSEYLDEAVESVIDYGNNLEDSIIRTKFDAKNYPEIMEKYTKKD
tara:strand:+ start:11001 stop:11828 length:828 start_codon:yes stop_codon:yes gene_type:complete